MAKGKPPHAVNITTIRTAEMLIERHGDRAAAFAQAQADRLAKTGNAESAIDWHAVILAIQQLQSERRKR